VTFEAVHVQGAETVAREAVAAGVARLVLVSGIGADPDLRTIGLKNVPVAWCLAVQFAECCFGKLSMRVPSGKKKKTPSS
jgi:hypothetical protein